MADIGWVADAGSVPAGRSWPVNRCHTGLLLAAVLVLSWQPAPGMYWSGVACYLQWSRYINYILKNKLPLKHTNTMMCSF